MTASSDPSRSGIASAVPPSTDRPTPGPSAGFAGSAPPSTLPAASRANWSRMAATGSTATRVAPVAMSCRVSLPVPAARSSTVAPGATRSRRTSSATASSG